MAMVSAFMVCFRQILDTGMEPDGNREIDLRDTIGILQKLFLLSTE
jgi:hypothetical protein